MKSHCALKLPYLREFGLRFGDILFIAPMQGKQRTLKIQRTKYMISFKPIYCAQLEGDQIILPHTEEIKNVFEMVMLSTSEDQQEENGRYVLKALQDMPFKLGSSYSRESYLCRGDILILGHNEIKMNSEKKIQEQESFEVNDHLAKSDLPILIEGETGTGKTTLAKKIHDESKKLGSFVHVNLSSFSPSLIESELFGHTKGAFTGAINDKIGALLEANHGTLFIDEIDSLPLEIQTKLLLFLDSKQVRAVGASSEKKTSARLIFASGCRLEKRVEDGLMRRDFYYRLKMGATIYLKSLREEPQRIKDFCKSYAIDNNLYISKQLEDYYSRMKWPGNLRELKGHLDKKKVLCFSSRFEFDSIDQSLQIENTSLMPQEQFVDLETFKRNYSLNVYNRLNRDIKKTTKVLGITPITLKKWINC